MYAHTAMHRPGVTRADTWHDKKETARWAAFPQLAGRFTRVWQVLGSNQRRLSRRFYSPLAVRGCRVPWYERSTDRGGTAHGRPRTSARTGAEKATDGAGGSGYADRSHPDSRSDLPF